MIVSNFTKDEWKMFVSSCDMSEEQSGLNDR